MQNTPEKGRGYRKTGNKAAGRTRSKAEQNQLTENGKVALSRARMGEEKKGKNKPEEK